MAVSAERAAMEEAAALIAAQMIGLVLPPACRPGVAANMALLADHATQIDGLDDDAAWGEAPGAASGDAPAPGTAA